MKESHVMDRLYYPSDKKLIVIEYDNTHFVVVTIFKRNGRGNHENIGFHKTKGWRKPNMIHSINKDKVETQGEKNKEMNKTPEMTIM